MDTLLLKALFKETQQDRIDTSTFGLRLRFLGLDPFAAFVSASVRLVDRRFCHATGNRTNEQRERGIFFAGKKISTAGKWGKGGREADEAVGASDQRLQFHTCIARARRRGIVAGIILVGRIWIQSS